MVNETIMLQVLIVNVVIGFKSRFYVKSKRVSSPTEIIVVAAATSLSGVSYFSS